LRPARRLQWSGWMNPGTIPAPAVSSDRMSSAEPRRATFADLEVRPEKPYAEVIGGVVVDKALPRFDHGRAQLLLGGVLAPHFDRAPGGADRPGGWWLASECTIELEPHEVYQPDLAGWRRERVHRPPQGYPVRIRPDWVCEILSPSNRRYDTVEKLRVYQRHGVGHYWLLDPDAGTLTVYRDQGGGYLVALVAGAAERVRAEPFDAIELAIGELLGDEPGA
jgi:Uma2 family endonuclease